MPFSVFCGANRQKRLIFLFCLKSVSAYYNLWNKKPKCNIWRLRRKSIPYLRPQGLTKIPECKESQDSSIYSASNLRILMFENAKFSVYWFYMNTNIQGDFQICISFPLRVIWGYSFIFSATSNIDGLQEGRGRKQRS